MTDRYVVIGNPIGHSKSPRIHAFFARETHQDMRYDALLAPLDGFAASVRGLVAEGGRGANVTVPFKLQAHALADELLPRAQAAGAVNTLLFKNGRILGDNTDGAGLVRDLTQNAGLKLRGARVLLLGAGGAARGVMLPLLQQGPAELALANRTVSKADELVQAFAHHADGCRLRASGFQDVQGNFDLVINATSASLDAQLPPISPAVFAPGALAYDMMYGSAPTVFLRFAAEHGAATRDGLGMLIEQAAESFFLWRGIMPPTAALFDMLRS